MNIKNKVRSSYPSNAQGINNSIAEDSIVEWNKYMHKDQFLQPDVTTPDNQKITLKTDANGNLQGKNAHNTQMLAERILQDYAITCLPSYSKLSLNKQYTHELAQKDLEYLNLKLDAVRKTITSGDVYNIQGVAESEEEVDHLISVATPNTAFISNVRVEKQHIAPGDIVFTDLNNQVHIIQHAAAGYFYPALWKNITGNTYQLTYSGSTTEPESKDIQQIPSDSISSTAYDKMFAEMNVGSNIGFAQTFVLAKNTVSEPFQYPNHPSSLTKKAIPLVTVLTEGGEKIGLDNILTQGASENSGILTNPTSMKIIVEVR